MDQLGELAAGLCPSEVFASYWHLASERQLIFYRRLAGLAAPWTGDDILASHRFTNAYRASDRVSQYLINNVIPDSAPHPDDMFFRIVLFKIFNRIETWEMLERELGPLHSSGFSVAAADQVLARALASGQRIYSAAYIMPSPPFGHRVKHSNHLDLLRLMMRDELPERMAGASSLEEAYRKLLAYPSIGPFLAYQYVIDLNYSTLLNFDESDFVMPGPGAVDGIRKCFGNTGGLSGADLIRLTSEVASGCCEALGLCEPSLWGRPLKLIDYQNLYCEVGKYARVAHPGIAGTSRRTRIKHRFRPIAARITAQYPDKWGLPRSRAFVDGVSVPYGGARRSVGDAPPHQVTLDRPAVVVT